MQYLTISYDLAVFGILALALITFSDELTSKKVRIKIFIGGTLTAKFD